MRRTRLIAMFALAALLVTACGGTEDEGGEDPGTRVVQTEEGEVTVPEDPERVVTLDWQSPPGLIDLGVTPVGILSGNYEGPAAAGVPDRYTKALTDATRVGGWDSISTEKLLELEPDLIVASELEDKVREQLEDVAPVAIVGTDGGWLGVQERLADVVNRTDEFEDLRADFEEAADEVADEHDDVLESSTFVSVSGGQDGQWFIEQQQTPAGVLLAAVGAKVTKESAVDGYWSDPLSYEKIRIVDDADVILYSADDDGTPKEGTAQLVKQRLYTSLDAVEAGNSLPFAGGDAASLAWATEELDGLSDALGAVKSP